MKLLVFFRQSLLFPVLKNLECATSKYAMYYKDKFKLLIATVSQKNAVKYPVGIQYDEIYIYIYS